MCGVMINHRWMMGVPTSGMTIYRKYSSFLHVDDVEAQLRDDDVLPGEPVGEGLVIGMEEQDVFRKTIRWDSVVVHFEDSED